MIETTATVCTKIFRHIQRLTQTMPSTANVTVHVHPAIAERLHNEERIYVAELEQNLRVRLAVKSNSSLRQSQFEVLPI
jgi:Ribonuclease G/E